MCEQPSSNLVSIGIVWHRRVHPCSVPATVVSATSAAVTTVFRPVLQPRHRVWVQYGLSVHAAACSSPCWMIAHDRYAGYPRLSEIEGCLASRSDRLQS